MSTLFKRLVNLTRAHLYDLLDKPTWRTPGDRQWHTDCDADDREAAHNTSQTSTSSPGTSTHAASALPYSAELARCYALLDLPFGVPMDQVSKRWKSYLKKCHPDRYANAPEKLADATELTQALTGAHDTILAAWRRYHEH